MVKPLSQGKRLLESPCRISIPETPSLASSAFPPIDLFEATQATTLKQVEWLESGLHEGREGFAELGFVLKGEAALAGKIEGKLAG